MSHIDDQDIDSFDEDEASLYEEEYAEEVKRDEKDLAKDVTHLPELKYYMRTYAKSLGDNDKKACEAFKQYESHERIRRLQNELLQIKEARASENICNILVGKKRKSRFKSYEHWGELMLLWITQAKR